MESINPVYIPENHIVEKIIEEVAVKKKKIHYSTLFLRMIENPFKYSKDFHELSKPQKPDEIIKNTFLRYMTLKYRNIKLFDSSKFPLPHLPKVELRYLIF